MLYAHMHTLWRGVLAARVLCVCIMDKGVVVDRMLYTHTHTVDTRVEVAKMLYTHTLWSGVVATNMLYSCNVDRSNGCQDTIHMH